ncbi:MAG TPA: pyruvate dehydrogenase (acetyl-transferring), homodimeric type [Gammaproteobacteria bacterium]|nr:pyruvate dehydrogenase (acetyl-transferring), homodimeric type [Gammaproteobacteria bacterium]
MNKGFNRAMTDINDNRDIDPRETQEWLEAIDNVSESDGSDRARFILNSLIQRSRDKGYPADFQINTPYRNTIKIQDEPFMMCDPALEQKIRCLVRWNALAMVVRAQGVDDTLGGHIGSFASCATLYDVGFNHFFRGLDHPSGGDLLYIQGHTSPGIYSRSFLMGDISLEQIEHFRREVGGKGLSSYPHPRLMPHYWQFPTVSMGLGPLQAIYQARFMRYLVDRDLAEKNDRHVWCFCGDGEMDEPESLGAISLAVREKLDNLIFVVNCNLQRLDGPVRGNGKIIQELEAVFRGAGWHVIKVVWGALWDPLLAKDEQGLLQKRMDEALDGEYQTYKARGGAYTRQNFFGKYDELKKMVADLSDDDIWHLNRGGHDPKKIFAAYSQAVKHKGQPVVILAKTVKGYGLGAAGEALNIAHNVKKMKIQDIKAFRDRFNLPIPDRKIEEVPFYKPPENSPEIVYLKERRHQLGGQLPKRRHKTSLGSLAVPGLEAFEPQLQGSGDRSQSTTMAFVRLLTNLTKDKTIGKLVVPIVPDEARTFGMEGLFRQIGIYSSEGQKYEPEDSEQVMFYKEAKDGQILEEGITEAGAMSSWMAAGSSYSNHDFPMIPFFIFYSMFGMQRVGDLAWAAGDLQARGFLLGATSGRTTLNGEGLQHQDGHSHILASNIPNCVAYDPTFAYELAVIIQQGLERMLAKQENVFYYITLMNENYTQPAMPANVISGILKGMYCFQQAPSDLKIRVQLLGSGSILNEVIMAASLLQKDFNIGADVWSVTSFTELRREGQKIHRWNNLHPDQALQKSYVEACLENTQGPVIAATDYVTLFSDQIREFVPRQYITLGTDGFGRSDTRSALRHHFEVDRYYIAYNAISALVKAGTLNVKAALKAQQLYNIDPEKSVPISL